LPVANVFMDEAGDLGFSFRSSQSYVIGYVITTSHTPHFIRNKCCRLLRKVNSRLKNNKKISEFKFSVDSDYTRLKFCNLISSLGIDAGVIAIRKDSVKDGLKTEPNILYNYLTVHHVVPVIIRNYLKSTMPVNRIRFKIDKSLSRVNQDKFNYYFENEISFIRRREGFKADVLAEIDHENSHNDVCLQIADYIAGSVFRRIEHLDSKFYDIIKNKIKYREKWDWNEKFTW